MNTSVTSESLGENFTSSDPAFPSSPAKLSLASYIVELSILTFTFVIGTIGNGIVLLYNLAVKDKKNALEVFILGSALMDFIVAFVFIPMQMYTTLRGKWDFGNAMCTVHLILGLVTTSISQCFNLAISLFCLVKCVLKPHYNFKVSKALYWSAAIIILNCLLMIVPVLVNYITVSFEHRFLLLCWIGASKNFQTFALLAIVPTMHVPTGIAIIIYGIIIIKSKGTHGGSEMKKNKKQGKAMMGLFAIFTLCFVPNTFLRFTQSFLPAPPSVLRVSKHILYLYVALNPIYYTSRIKTLVPSKLLKMLQRGAVTSEASTSSGTTSNSNPGPATMRAGGGGVGGQGSLKVIRVREADGPQETGCKSAAMDQSQC